MKKTKIIIPVILLILAIGLSAAYFIYGSTLVDITSEKSISSALASEKNKPVNIIKTAKNGEFFGVLYTDPADEDEGYYHFKYITKAKYYKNKYKNAGGSTDIINDPSLGYDVLNQSGGADKTVKTFVYKINGNLPKDNKCSVFEYDSKGTDIVYEKISNEKEIIKRQQKLANTYRKIDEFEFPKEKTYIISKNYELSSPDKQILFVEGSVSAGELKKQTMNDVNSIVKEYHEYRGEGKK